MRLAAALALLSLLPACSIAFVKDPPKPVPADGQVICTESPALPVVDFVLAAATVAGAYGVVSFERIAYDDGYHSNPLKITAVTALFMAPWIASGIVGLVWTGQCRRIHRTGR